MISMAEHRNLEALCEQLEEANEEMKREVESLRDDLAGANEAADEAEAEAKRWREQAKRDAEALAEIRQLAAEALEDRRTSADALVFLARELAVSEERLGLVRDAVEARDARGRRLGDAAGLKRVREALERQIPPRAPGGVS